MNVAANSKKGAGRRGNIRRRTVDFPIQHSLSKQPKIQRKKASFDSNVDKDEIDENDNAILPHRPENGCLTPSESDDDELPDVSFSSSQDSSINKGDLMWVKYGGAPFWPAVVLRVYTKKGRIGKLTVVFIGNHGARNTDPDPVPWFRRATFAYRSNIVIPYGVKNDQLKQEARESECSKELLQSIRTGEDYVQKKAWEGVDHEEYFAEELGIAEERFIRKLEEEGALNEETLRKVIPQVEYVDVVEEQSEEEEKQNLDEDDDAPDKPLTEADRKRQEWRIQQSKSIVEKIKSQHCRDYLDKIRCGKVETERHKQYYSATTNKARHGIALSHGYGPILDEHWDVMVQEMTDYANKKYGSGEINLSYLLDVWIPEAIVYAIQRVRKISRTKAEIVFKNGIRSTKKEREQSSKALIRNHKNIAPEDIERYNQRNQRFMEEFCAGSLSFLR